MTNKKSIFLFSFFAFAFCQLRAQVNYASLVNPFIGTGGHGHTFPGPLMPFGMVQVGPDTRVDGSWDGCSGYHYTDSIIYGFSHTHLSGTGCSDYGDIMVMPVVSEMKVKGDEHSYLNPANYRSVFSHKNEKAEAGYYSVLLSKYQIKAELTASTRTAIHRYTFPNTNNASIVLDLTHRDKLLDGKIEVVDEYTVKGYRFSKAWAGNQKVWFYIRFNKKMKLHTVGNGNYITGNKLATGNQVKAMFTFPNLGKEPLLLKVSISGVDEEGALNNMETEVNHWDFEKVRSNSVAAWNKELSKIEVYGGSKDERIVFYTSLYHCFTHPSVYSDCDGRYRGRDDKIYTAKNFTYYTVFSIWDTFRALHPLFNLVQPERNRDFIVTFLEQFKQVGRLPIWELSSNETDCMIGYHSVSVITDAFEKGIRNFDTLLAAEAIQKTPSVHKYGADLFLNQHYLSVEDENESVSKTLEYAYDSWCAARYLNRITPGNAKPFSFPAGEEWQFVFNPANRFMQARYNGGWHSPFLPNEVNNYFTEANSWQYSFFVPQNLPALILAMGGLTEFEHKLDELFSASSQTTGRNQADITGLVGQYAQGNEPSHHMAYLYNYVGKTGKTQKLVNRLLKDMYQNKPDGLSGNEDCGQMSAWYVFSAMGMYPVTPGLPEYQLGTSVFNKVVLHQGSKVCTLTYNKKSANDIYVRRIDKPDVTSINHFELFPDNSNTSSNLNFETSAQPFNVNPVTTGYSFTPVPVPVILADSKTYKDSLLIRLQTTFNNPGEPFTLYYTIETPGTAPLTARYNKPFYIHKSCRISAYSDFNYKDQKITNAAYAQFFRISHNWDISIKNKYNKQYTAGGPEGLIDGIKGDLDWRKGNWQGYQYTDFEATIDLKQDTLISTVSADFLQDQRSWILMPKEVEFLWSADGKEFNSFGTVKTTVPDSLDKTIIETLDAPISKPVTCRYIKVKAKNYGKFPKWHVGYGDSAFIFIDEISIH